MIGVLGGLGPAATVDFLGKIVSLTPATRDQEHIPVITASLPHVHDRSAFIMGNGPDPLPELLRGIDLLNANGVGVLAVPCNSAHHWYDRLSAHSKSPILHIADACVAQIRQPPGSKVLILATRGTLKSGFYQIALTNAGFVAIKNPPSQLQILVDECIRQVKSGALEIAGDQLSLVLDIARQIDAAAVIMGCTEIPVAARYCENADLELLDSSLALAHAVVEYAIERNWHIPV